MESRRTLRKRGLRPTDHRCRLGVLQQIFEYNRLDPRGGPRDRRSHHQARGKRTSRSKFIDDRNASSARTERQGESVPPCTWVVRAQTSTCYSSLSFVCVKPAFDVSTFSLHKVPEICQAGEYGNYQLPVCISPGNTTVTFYKAEKKCLASRAGTSLYNAEGIFSRLINKIIRNVIIQSSVADNLAWVSRNMSSNTCQALSVTSDPTQTISRDCGSLLPNYLCESPAAVPVLQNVTVMKGGFPVVSVTQGSKNFTARLPLFSPLDNHYESSSTFTDYYWCQVNDPVSGTIKQSRRIFLRISEMEIYAASIVINSTLELRTLLMMYSMTGDDPNKVVQPLLTRTSASPDGGNLTLGEFYVSRRYDFSHGKVRPVNNSVMAAKTSIRNAARKNIQSLLLHLGHSAISAGSLAQWTYACVTSSDVCDLCSRLLAQSDINAANVADRVNETKVLFTPIPFVQINSGNREYRREGEHRSSSEIRCDWQREEQVWNLSNSTSKDVSVGLELQTDGDTAVDGIGDGKLVTLFDSTSRDYQLTDTAIMLPGSFKKHSPLADKLHTLLLAFFSLDNSDKNLKVIFNLFANTALFKQGHLTTNGTGPNVTLNTKVISAKLSLDGAPVTNLSGYNVTTVYIPVVKLVDEARRLSSTCVFWDFQAAGGRGGWSSDGCYYHSVIHGRDVCVCNHLTNFAVLLVHAIQQTIARREKEKITQRTPPADLVQHGASLCFGAWIVFLGGIDRVDNTAGCIAVAAMLHYLILSSFICWMALTPFYFAFLLPVGLIVLTNVIIYCLVIAAICSRRIEGSTSAESNWIFAFLAVADARLVFQYLFTITTTVQGFLLFVIFTARDPAFRTFWLEKCCGKSSHHSTSGAKARTRDVSGNSLESPMTRSTTCSDTRLDLISKRSPPPSPRKWPPSPSVPSSRI
ncbi:hypothetical protein C0Q70_00928 [Pomacea canaliculata]|uniref:GAIN-B domain-containing protein n=1 Tax=Pomacea canaliculata TaxID=400727 RepID=A0A2T7PY14_POMCA|nr:hypothetical protein C0Q70_00928 [Pomacea canaliculata]